MDKKTTIIVILFENDPYISMPCPGVSVPATSTRELTPSQPHSSALYNMCYLMASDRPVYFSTIGVGFMEVYQHYWGRFSQHYFLSICDPGTPPPVNSTSDRYKTKHLDY